MIERIEESLMLASAIDHALLEWAHECVDEARLSNDESVRDRLFDRAARLRRISEFAATVCRHMDDEREEQRRPTAREIEGARKRRRPRLVVVGGGL